MELIVRHSGNVGDELDEDRAASVVTQALRRFTNRIQRVSLYFQDVNGPRGGVDKQCRCVIHGSRLRTIVIRDQDAKTSHLVHRVANRATRVLRDRLTRRTRRRRPEAVNRTVTDRELQDSLSGRAAISSTSVAHAGRNRTDLCLSQCCVLRLPCRSEPGCRKHGALKCFALLARSS